MRNIQTTALVLATIALAGAAVHAQTPLTTVRVANGLVRPIYVTHAPGDFERLFVVERAGRVRIIKNGTLLGAPYLDISTGLLALGPNDAIFLFELASNTTSSVYYDLQDMIVLVTLGESPLAVTPSLD